MRVLASLLALVFAASPGLAGEPAALNRSELRSLSDEALARRIFGPLAPDLFVSNRSEQGMRLGGPEIAWFWTRPRRDWLRPGICVTDRIIVHLEPGVSVDQSLRLRGMVLQTYLIVQNRELASRLTGIDPQEMGGLAAACAALDPRRNAIPADNGWQLMRAFSLANALGEAARAERVPVPVDCRLDFFGPPTGEAECLSALSRLREEWVAGVADCGDAIVFGGPCVRVQTSEWFIYFVLRQDQAMERIIVRGIEDTSAIE